MIPIKQYEEIDKREKVSQWIDSINYNASKIKLPETDKPRIVVCFTSWPKRIDYCSVLINDIYERQTLKPDYIFLTLCDSEFPDYEASLPEDLRKLAEQDKVKILWNGNFNAKLLKKMLPVLPILNDEDIIITVDDDNYNCLPSDIFEKRVNDYLKYKLPVTSFPPCIDQTIWMSGSTVNLYNKKMFEDWETFIDDEAFISLNDDAIFTMILAYKGIIPMTGTAYSAPAKNYEDIFSKIDEHAASKNGIWLNNYNFQNSKLQNWNHKVAEKYLNEYFTNSENIDRLNKSLKTGNTIHIAMTESTQWRVDTLLYNCIKSFIISNSFTYNLDFTILTPKYIDYSKVEKLLAAYNITYKFINEDDVKDNFEYIKTCVNYSGPYNKLPLYEYMRKYDWYLYIDDDLIAREGFRWSIFESFLKTGKPFGMVDDYQPKYISPVLYTDKYGLETEFNAGVILVNNEYLPNDLLTRFKEVNDEYYTNNPDMPTFIDEQIPFNIAFRNDIYPLPTELNYKPYSHPNDIWVTIYHYAGFDKKQLVDDPLSINEGWYYYLTNKFKMLDTVQGDK